MEKCAPEECIEAPIRSSRWQCMGRRQARRVAKRRARALKQYVKQAKVQIKRAEALAPQLRVHFEKRALEDDLTPEAVGAALARALGCRVTWWAALDYELDFASAASFHQGVGKLVKQWEQRQIDRIANKLAKNTYADCAQEFDLQRDFALCPELDARLARRLRNHIQSWAEQQATRVGRVEVTPQQHGKLYVELHNVVSPAAELLRWTQAKAAEKRQQQMCKWLEQVAAQVANAEPGETYVCVVPDAAQAQREDELGRAIAQRYGCAVLRDGQRYKLDMRPPCESYAVRTESAAQRRLRLEQRVLRNRQRAVDAALAVLIGQFDHALASSSRMRVTVKAPHSTVTLCDALHWPVIAAALANHYDCLVEHNEAKCWWILQLDKPRAEQ